MYTYLNYKAKQTIQRLIEYSLFRHYKIINYLYMFQTILNDLYRIGLSVIVVVEMVAVVVMGNIKRK